MDITGRVLGRKETSLRLVTLCGRWILPHTITASTIAYIFRPDSFGNAACLWAILLFKGIRFSLSQ